MMGLGWESAPKMGRRRSGICIVKSSSVALVK
jgi:hypothetical protein